MSDIIKIQPNGYTANNNPLRATRSGEEYEELFPAPDWQEKVVSRNADVTQTVNDMMTLIKRTAWQTKKISERLKAHNTYTTCKNIWNFLYDHFKYKEDDQGQEQLRTPALSWYLRTIRGIDCDDFTILASSIMYNLGIPCYLRIAKYKEKHFQHVYDTVPQTKNSYITIDAVLDQFDTEKQATQIKDFLLMNPSKLNGIDVTVLSGVEDDFFNELSGILTAKDFDPLEGLGAVPTTSQQLDAVYNHLLRTQDLIQKNPDSIKQVQDPNSFLKMINYAINYWHTDKRDLALSILAQKEQEQNELQGINNMPDGYEEAQLYYGVEGLNGITGLGKLKSKSGFFSAVKNVVHQATQAVTTVVQNTTQSIKNTANTLVKYNPASIAVRAGILLAMKTNLFSIAEKLKWAYLTEDEAKTHGFDIAEWKNVKKQLQKAEQLYVNILQGNNEDFKKAILTGKAGALSSLSGTNEELGVVAATAVAASITAAMPFIKKLLDFSKEIDVKKLVAKVTASKLMQSKKKAEIETAAKIKQEAEQNNQQSAPSQLPTVPDNKSDIQENTNTASATQKENNTPTPDDTNPLTKAMDWVKENPGKTALLAGGLILAFSESARKMIGLGASPKRGKKRSGKAKKNPPKTISGTVIAKKKAAKKKSTKTTKAKPKNKGGKAPRITL
jgi:hypothetical protein